MSNKNQTAISMHAAYSELEQDFKAWAERLIAYEKKGPKALRNPELKQECDEILMHTRDVMTARKLFIHKRKTVRGLPDYFFIAVSESEFNDERQAFLIKGEYGVEFEGNDFETIKLAMVMARYSNAAAEIILGESCSN